MCGEPLKGLQWSRCGQTYQKKCLGLGWCGGWGVESVEREERRWACSEWRAVYRDLSLDEWEGPALWRIRAGVMDGVGGVCGLVKAPCAHLKSGG